MVLSKWWSDSLWSWVCCSSVIGNVTENCEHIPKFTCLMIVVCDYMCMYVCACSSHNFLLYTRHGLGRTPSPAANWFSVAWASCIQDGWSTRDTAVLQPRGATGPGLGCQSTWQHPHHAAKNASLWPVCAWVFVGVGLPARFCFCLWCGSRMVAGKGSEVSRTYVRCKYYCRMVLAMWYCKPVSHHKPKAFSEFEISMWPRMNNFSKAPFSFFTC